MIACRDFYHRLARQGVGFYCGVPDSLLKSFCAYLLDNVPPDAHIITANEGNAVALAAGYYLATRKIALVYMQNSGLGNAINPLVSLVDPLVYKIPVLLLIGWRGRPGEKDEPQHIKQGRSMPAMLKALGVPFALLPDSPEKAGACVEKACVFMKKKERPYALIACKNIFESYVSAAQAPDTGVLSREEAVGYIADQLTPRDIVIATTGKISRELFECRTRRRQQHKSDFLVIGSMGHASQVALGVALQKPGRLVFCLDGDGAVIMHMGCLAIIGSKRPANFKHIILNNGAHDSVGGQPTAGYMVDFTGIARACGYAFAMRAETAEDAVKGIALLKEARGPALLEICVRKGARKDLGRPRIPPQENKKDFMDFMLE